MRVLHIKTHEIQLSAVLYVLHSMLISYSNILLPLSRKVTVILSHMTRTWIHQPTSFSWSWGLYEVLPIPALKSRKKLEGNKQIAGREFVNTTDSISWGGGIITGEEYAYTASTH